MKCSGENAECNKIIPLWQEHFVFTNVHTFILCDCVQVGLPGTAWAPIQKEMMGSLKMSSRMCISFVSSSYFTYVSQKGPYKYSNSIRKTRQGEGASFTLLHSRHEIVSLMFMPF